MNATSTIGPEYARGDLVWVGRMPGVVQGYDVDLKLYEVDVRSGARVRALSVSMHKMTPR